MCALGTLWIKNCHCERKYGDPAGYCIMGPNGILCTRWEKEYASVRQTFVACDDCLVKNEAYDAEEKAQTSKRQTIVASDNRLVKSAVYDACAYRSSASCVGVSSGSYVSKVISAGKQPYIPSGSYIFGANAAWLISFLLFNDFINPPPFILCKTENSIRLEKDNSRLL